MISKLSFSHILKSSCNLISDNLNIFLKIRYCITINSVVWIFRCNRYSANFINIHIILSIYHSLNCLRIVCEIFVLSTIKIVKCFLHTSYGEVIRNFFLCSTEFEKLIFKFISYCFCHRGFLLNYSNASTLILYATYASIMAATLSIFAS